MIVEMFTPRFSDTDALGHINNASVATWFEETRRPIFQLFVPDLDPKKWNLIIARVEVDYLAQIDYGSDVEIRTGLEKIGNSSMTVMQEVWLGNACKARGRAVMVHFDYSTNSSSPIPPTIRRRCLPI